MQTKRIHKGNPTALTTGWCIATSIFTITVSNKEIFTRGLLYDKKKISQVPAEAMNQAIVDYTDYYLSEVAQMDFTKLHFFDESSVIVTSGNRKYGTSHKGEPAIEMQ